MATEIARLWLTDPFDEPAAELPAQSTREEAELRRVQIRNGVRGVAAWWDMVNTACLHRDWLTLEYHDWRAYFADNVTEPIARLSRDERRGKVADLRAMGMTTRAIAAALDVPKSTVSDDLRQVSGSGHLTGKVTGFDGKSYPATRPAPSTQDVPAGDDGGRVAPTPAPPAVGPDTPPSTARPTSEGGAGSPTEIPRPAGEPERPKPPAWDPAERAAHEADVRRRQDIEAAHQQAKTLVPDVRAHIFTVLAGYRLGEKHLVTRDMIADLRAAVDLLEKEIDGEA